MPKLNAEQKKIKDLFMDKGADFLIPDYQRPYAWEKQECQTLWEDIFAFAFPDNDFSKFDKTNDKYFLGPIVIFRNERNKLEVIDGQQRLTTLMLLLRAFYVKFKNMEDVKSRSIRSNLEKCIWKTDEFDLPNFDELKIDSEVASDDAKDEFLSILRIGEADKNSRSNYAKNFLLFQEKIEEFIANSPSYYSYLPARIMENCLLLPIEAETQDFALRIFSTLNDRGKPLSDSDIFKAQFYKFYADMGEKDKFISRWKNLEEKCEKNFSPTQGTPLDDLFTRYMYYVRAKLGIRDTTTEALRKFYEKENYKILKTSQTLDDLEQLVDFWENIKLLDSSVFSDKILRKLYVLNYAPNSMWEYITSVYFMQNKNEAGELEEDAFYTFLDRITAFIFIYAVMFPGVNSLRAPIYPEMINIVNGIPVKFENFKFNAKAVRDSLKNYVFSNQRPVTKSLLTWWAFNDENQELFDPDEKLEIEHIFPKKRQEMEQSLKDPELIESIGNKAVLEKRINIRAADYRFSDKKKYYSGFTTDRGAVKKPTKNRELLKMAKSDNAPDDFTEQDIISRENQIFDGFIKYLESNSLLN